MNKKFLNVAFALVLTAALLSSCGGSAPATEKAQPLRVGWSLWPGYYPILIAAEKGFFEQRGVEVQPVYYEFYGMQSSELASGMIDGGLIVLSDALFDSVSAEIKIVMITDNSLGADAIVASGKITQLSDLRGKRIGVEYNNVGGMLLARQMLRAAGISPAEATLVQITPEEVPASIPNLIQAGYTFEPHVSAARAKGQKVIYSSADAPGLLADTLAFRRSVIQARPQDVRAFIAAWFDAVDYWKANPEEGNAIIAQATGLAQEEISLEGVDLFNLHANQQAFKRANGYVSIYYAAEQELRYVIASGGATRPVDINELLDPSFLQ